MEHEKGWETPLQSIIEIYIIDRVEMIVELIVVLKLLKLSILFVKNCVCQYYFNQTPISFGL